MAYSSICAHSLFDQSKIVEDNFTFLIHPFEQIQYFNAVKLLKGNFNHFMHSLEMMIMSNLNHFLDEDAEDGGGNGRMEEADSDNISTEHCQ